MRMCARHSACLDTELFYLSSSTRIYAWSKCTPYATYCDGFNHCHNSGDEIKVCRNIFAQNVYPAKASPAVIRLDQKNNLVYDTFYHACPETHFQCNNNGYCLPVYTRCNGVNDCPQHEDEVGCEHLQCPGFYRCYDSKICLHSTHLCDATAQCPHLEDERFCYPTYGHAERMCPPNCTCFGITFICGPLNNFVKDLAYINWVRYLHTSDTEVHLEILNNLYYLIHVGLPHCGLRHFRVINLLGLHSLDLSDNHIQDLSWLQATRSKHLRTLSLSGNPLDQQVVASLEQVHSSLLTLDISHIQMQELKLSHYKYVPNLQALNLSQCNILAIKHDNSSEELKNLLYLDLHGSVVSNFPPDLFYHMVYIARVRTDNPKLCCPALYPNTSKTVECLTPVPDLMFCGSLLQTDGYRVLLFLFAVLSISGNAFSFIIRVFAEKATVTHGFAVFVTHLTLSDFLMGLYLTIIGIADQIYREDYFWQDNMWTHSVACETAGFLCLLSSEVSAFLIALITLDRYLVFRFPFRQVRFSVTSATITVVVVWIVGVALSAVPLLPVASHWTVYSNTATCLALPLVTSFPGRDYVFGVVIIVNFALFSLVALGQASIYRTIRDNSMPLQNSQSQNRDIHIARRLIAIVLSDFLCWFPVGLLAVLSSTGTLIPRELNMLVSISVMPLNSALNPFWYTLNLVLEKNRKQREMRILKTLMALTTN